jgi:hypothetical protein
MSLLTMMQALQKAAARDQCVPEGLANLAHHDAYAKMFEVLHYEKTIRSRFLSRSLPKGL